MILYKHYGFQAGLSALRSSRLGFREPRHFNDPFELSNLDNASGPVSKLTDWQSTLYSLKSGVGILSLTREPLNPLMWAHYSQEHTGFVIGYEVDIPFLNSVNYNLIPVDRGDVVYTNSKIPHVVTSDTRRLLSKLFVASMGFAFDDADRSGLETLMRKAFLIKHAAWVYEEEVRVVKPLVNHAMTIEEEYENIYFGSDTLSYEVAPGHAVSSVEGLYLYKHPIEIKEVYLGLRNPLIADGIVVSRGDSVDLDHSLRIKAEGESWKIFALEMTAGTWQLEKKRLDPFSLILVDRALEGAQSHLTGIQAKMLKEKLQTIDFDAEDNFTISNWRQRTYIKKNNDWLD